MMSLRHCGFFIRTVQGLSRHAIAKMLKRNFRFRVAPMQKRINKVAAAVAAIRAEKINEENISELLNWEIAEKKNTANVNPAKTEPMQLAAYKRVPPCFSFNTCDASGRTQAKKKDDGNI